MGSEQKPNKGTVFPSTYWNSHSNPGIKWHFLKIDCFMKSDIQINYFKLLQETLADTLRSTPGYEGIVT